MPLRIIVAEDERDTVLEFDPDAVLLDMGLPELSGYEVARKIRECCGNKRPLLIGMSGRYKQDADRTLAEVNGVNHYLIKPCRPDSVIALLAPLKKAAH